MGGFIILQCGNLFWPKTHSKSGACVCNLALCTATNVGTFCSPSPVSNQQGQRDQRYDVAGAARPLSTEESVGPSADGEPLGYHIERRLGVALHGATVCVATRLIDGLQVCLWPLSHLLTAALCSSNNSKLTVCL